MSMENLCANLRRLMNKNGYSIPKMEEISGVSRATISNILNGKADPSHSILEKLAKGLGATILDLYANKPILKSLRFRTNKNLTAREKAAKETLLYTICDKLNIYQQVEKYTPKLTISDFSKYPKEPISAAHKLRKELSLQPDSPVTNFCGRLTYLGIKQFYFNFGLSKTFGVSINKDDGGPAIFVNTGTANVERWIFTMFHELGHIILQPESYNGQEQIEDKYSKEEADANLFAAEFLLPVEVVIDRVKGTKNYSFINKVIELKQEFSTSYKLVLKQYCRAFSREEEDVIPKFQRMYGKQIKHDFKNFYEPNALPKERYSFEDANFRMGVLEAVTKNDMEIKTAAELLHSNEEAINEELAKFTLDIPF